MALVGIDIGGTKIAAGVVSLAGKVLARGEIATHPERSPGDAVARTTELVRTLEREAGVRARVIGVCCPGPLDLKRGVVLDTPNLRRWWHFPLQARLQRALKRPVRLENDANAAAVAEHRLGAGRGANDMLYLTISTGVGGGVIINGSLYRGAQGFGGELGHVSLDLNGPVCGCGARGCIEALASGTAIAKRVQTYLELAGASAAARARPVTAVDVVAGVRRGDPICTRVWNDAMYALGLGIGSLANAFNPELFVLGGGLTAAGTLLFKPVRKHARASCMKPIARKLTVVRAQLGRDVGILGAALCAGAPAR